MLMSLLNSKDFWKPNLYHGKTVGRTANRIAGNKICIDDQISILENNENENTLHGGVSGLSTKVFISNVLEEEGKATISYSYISKEGESGFPGTLKVVVTYVIEENSSKIKLYFDAETDKSTFCDLTNHAFFILGEENLQSLSLRIDSSNYLKTEEDTLLPIKMEPVFSELDFRNSKPILKDIHSSLIEKGKANGYDHYFAFDDRNTEPHVFLQSKNLNLEISTDFPGVQIYSDNYEDDEKWNFVKGKNNRSIAIEPGDNYLNRKVLKPNEKYHHFIEYNFIKNN